MRLIDADELIYMELGKDTDRPFRFVPTGFIEDAETVDAIPIKWLEKYRKKKKKIYGGVDIYSGLQDVINDWRKENESNNNS